MHERRADLDTSHTLQEGAGHAGDGGPSGGRGAALRGTQP